MNKLNYILTIGGHDPSGGAGLTSDIKTFEAHGLYGLSVCTAITVQNDIAFVQCDWISIEVILAQINLLFERFPLDVVKIGIVESWQNLSIITKQLRKLNSEIKIILDPVLKASSGFDFHHSESLDFLDKVLSDCYMVTPNYEEIQSLYPDKSVDETIAYISDRTNIYLKGGHRTYKKGWDFLYFNKIIQLNIPPLAEVVSEKHGSGCVLSSSLASAIALGLTIEEGAFHAKKYTEGFLNSDLSLLGVHTYPAFPKKAML
ncbi:hydroxymethylpyrimidine/phosphomethylpyrimidine kinase [Flavobacterium tegetincola]|uniref:hydroxymethylpyrimidine/phosphomethylpyrimidine kinase n=1 Tax=Flavobacterium tegetincola TaxID=150172 RepID=UPI00040E4B76|nr:hydroxymethylpyrimidine/phosphomethylpyrimidine kinase [Flavobacterium tegetincola]